jgi:hypothetical protein
MELAYQMKLGTGDAAMSSIAAAAFEEASNNPSVGATLPPPDATVLSPINLGATAGKVALLIGTVSLWVATGRR